MYQSNHRKKYHDVQSVQILNQTFASNKRSKKVQSSIFNQAEEEVVFKLYKTLTPLMLNILNN